MYVQIPSLISGLKKRPQEEAADSAEQTDKKAKL
jgi:hypothetical protein